MSDVPNCLGCEEPMIEIKDYYRRYSHKALFTTYKCSKNPPCSMVKNSRDLYNIYLRTKCNICEKISDFKGGYINDRFSEEHIAHIYEKIGKNWWEIFGEGRIIDNDVYYRLCKNENLFVLCTSKKSKYPKYDANGNLLGPEAWKTKESEAKVIYPSGKHGFLCTLNEHLKYDYTAQMLTYSKGFPRSLKVSQKDIDNMAKLCIICDSVYAVNSSDEVIYDHFMECMNMHKKELSMLGSYCNSKNNSK